MLDYKPELEGEYSKLVRLVGEMIIKPGPSLAKALYNHLTSKEGMLDGIWDFAIEDFVLWRDIADFMPDGTPNKKEVIQFLTTLIDLCGV